MESKTYNWKINSEAISYDKAQSKPLVLSGDYLWYKNFKIINYIQKTQVHVYANMDCLDKINNFYKTNFNYATLYNELFRPSNHLEKSLYSVKSFLPKAYISICFRHRNLFGDFKEKHFEPLNAVRQKIFLEHCISKIKEIINCYDTEVVVTSDSLSFLMEINKISRVHIVNQAKELIHMDYTFSTVEDSFKQSFIDFYCLGGGDKIFLFGAYSSGFPILRAKCFSKELESNLENP